MTTGLVLGKFLPPHLGHQYLLDFAAHAVDELTVLVCSLPSEPIAGELRTRWVQELCPRGRVVHVTDENPSYPEEHPDFWEIWTRTVRNSLPTGPDLVFTSEDYGDELAARLGAVHQPVDPGRTLFPVSGTTVREDPLGHWEFLPECVRPHYVRRVALYGPESTGKSTLAARLAGHYRTVHVPEYARGLLDILNSRRDIEGFVTAEDLPLILRGQAASEEALARRANRLLFCDTEGLTTRVYSRHYFEVELPEPVRDYDLYLFCDVDVPWAPDPQRNLGDQRERFRQLFLDELGARPHEVLRGGWEERFQAACRAVQGLLGRR